MSSSPLTFPLHSPPPSLFPAPSFMDCALAIEERGNEVTARLSRFMFERQAELHALPAHDVDLVAKATAQLKQLGDEVCVGVSLLFSHPHYPRTHTSPRPLRTCF